ncbi:molybdate transport system permease protein [Reichenbachiella faecimaris]|uniref:Molybdenum transport system permease n=1 Tax=Reichenbachiella faecimaris TaxID=692418 RepID=A0A1W2GNC4_REIFA|nr:molybdate ABC transporter permease subunit [Reichenbachiella faecimaris]SMD38064.1 molybdate transport system permease protein [Reichenbachiella faecimaris]
MEDFLTPLWLSSKLALITTFSLFFLAVPVVYGLSMNRFFGQKFLKVIIALPLILPPSVLGFYLLLAFQPNSMLGTVWNALFDTRLAFSFQGILIASIIFSLPFMVNPILSAIENLPHNLTEASYSLGKTKWQTFYKVLLPNVRPSITSAAILTFAHTIGEFGVILMIGGNIPGETRVASIAIFHELERMNYEMANQYAAVLLGFSFIVLFLVQYIQKNPTRPIIC